MEAKEWMATKTSRHALLIRLRLHRRHMVVLPVRCVIQEDEKTFREVVGHTGNVGLGGVLTWLPEALAPGTVFRIQLGLPQGAVTAEGKVIWQDNDDEVGNRPIPHGVQFLGFVEDTGRMRFKRYLTEKATDRATRATEEWWRSKKG